MGKQWRQQTAPGQAALLFVVAGCLGLVSELFLSATAPRSASIALNLGNPAMTAAEDACASRKPPGC